MIKTILALLAASLSIAQADVIFSLDEVSTGTSSLTLTAGQSFNVDVYLSAANTQANTYGGADIAGFSLFLNTGNSAASGLFSFNSATVNSSEFSFPGGSPAAGVVPASGNLSVGNAFANGTIAVPQTNLLLEEINLTLSSSATAGIYTLDTSALSEALDENFGDDFQTTPGLLTIHVEAAPEPAATSTLVLSLAALLGAAGLWRGRPRAF